MVSSQSGDFSCMEITWEESSTKYKNFYGVVEEPREERIIPIKLERGISIHTASDEEDEPFWVVESVKKHEEVRNEIKKMKENKTSQASLTESDDEDDDNSLKELLKRVKKQRNDLENILEKENNNINISDICSSKQTLSRSNSILSESSTPKAISISRLSPLDEKIKNNELSNNETNELSSNKSYTYIKNKEQHSSITENISKTCLSNVTDKLDTPEKEKLTFDLSSDMTENDAPLQIRSLIKNGSNLEDSVLNTAKRNSISRLPSKEDNTNSFLPKKVTDKYTENSERKSLSRVFSNEKCNDLSIPKNILSNEYDVKEKSRSNLTSSENSKQEFTLEKSILPLTKQEESNTDILSKNLISNSFPPVKTEESSEKYFKIQNTINKEPNNVFTQNFNDLVHSPTKNNNLNEINFIPENNRGEETNNEYCTKINGSNDVNGLSALQTPKSDDADFRRKSLIKQSSILSDALNAICNDISEDSNYSKPKKSSNENEIDKKCDNSILGITIEKHSSNPQTELNDSVKSSSFDEIDKQDSFGRRKSNILSTLPDKNISNLKHTENDLISKLNDEKPSAKFNNELDNIPDLEKSQTSNTEVSRLPLDLNVNNKKISDFKKNESTTILSPKSTFNNAGENILSNKEILHNCEPYSAQESLPKSNDMKISKESILSNDINKSKNTGDDSNPTNFIHGSLSSYEKNNENKKMQLIEYSVNKVDNLNNSELNSNKINIEALHQPSGDRIDDENNDKLRLKTLENKFKEDNIESSNGIKQIGGIQNIKCYSNNSVVFYFMFVQKSSLFRLIKPQTVFFIII